MAARAIRNSENCFSEGYRCVFGAPNKFPTTTMTVLKCYCGDGMARGTCTQGREGERGGRGRKGKRKTIANCPKGPSTPGQGRPTTRAATNSRRQQPKLDVRECSHHPPPSDPDEAFFLTEGNGKDVKACSQAMFYHSPLLPKCMISGSSPSFYL